MVYFHEEWNVTEQKLKKVIKDELDIENVIITQALMVKRNNDDDDDNKQNRKPLTVATKLLHFKDKQDNLQEAKSRKMRNF